VASWTEKKAVFGTGHGAPGELQLRRNVETAGGHPITERFSRDHLRGQPAKLAFRGEQSRGAVMGLSQHVPENHDKAKQAELAEEAKRIRRLQFLMNMTLSVISQDPNMSLEEATEMAAGARRAALAMFPGKELAFDLIYRPRFQRIINERYRLQ
jgi:hypothetical protein